MTPRDLIDELRSRINPAYAAQIGTESYERRLCAETMETLLAIQETLSDEITKLRKIAAHVPAKTYIAAKEAAGFGERIKTPNVAGERAEGGLPTEAPSQP